ncbi:nucleic acid-binding protein [Rhypophila decipiens]|uniref:Nucleic acid-binding protein n=1 Tax=Rhypophila decipiens TaxID=261697 RepID=A0AAN7BF22_9PEZI|nr:nucleic acid-binding protein [Rhypophila decipiens]
MQSIRRAAFRSAVSASRAVSSPARSTPFAAQISRQTVAPIARPSAITSARFFSQTGRVANEKSLEEPVENQDGNQESVQATGSSYKGRNEPTNYGVFVRNLIFDATEEHLQSLFEKFGTVAGVRIARDAGKMSRGYAFVHFTNEQDRQEAIRSLDNTFWHGRRLTVSERTAPETTREARRSPRASLTSPTNCLYFGNIPYETTDVELNEMFSSLAGVVDVRVAVDRTTGWPRGFCHVDFKDEEAATAALEKMRGKTLRDRQLNVDFAAGRQPYKDRRNDGNDQSESGLN